MFQQDLNISLSVYDLATVILVPVGLVLLATFYMLLDLLLRELSHYFAIKKKWAKVPGVSTFYKRFNGFFSYYPGGPSNDKAELITKLVREEDNSKLLAFNWPGLNYGKVNFVLTDPKIIKEFLAKENDCTYRDNQANVFPLVNLGFVQKAGKEGLKMRAIFSEFFLYDNIKSLVPYMEKMIGEQLDSLVKKYAINSKEYVNINLKEFIMPTFYKWMALLLFGFDIEQPEMQIDLSQNVILKDFKTPIYDFSKKKVYNLIELSVIFTEHCFFYQRDMTNKFTFGLLAKYGLTNKYRGHQELRKVVANAVLKLYEMKLSKLSHSNGSPNVDKAYDVIDLMARHNYNSIAKNDLSSVVSQHDIVGNISAFIFAGLDSTLHTSVNGLMWMTLKYKRWFDIIRNENTSSTEKILQNKSLSSCIKEVLRLFNPIVKSFNRVLHKDTTLGGIRLPKGNSVIVPTLWTRYKKSYEDAFDFKPERFFEENLSKPVKDAFIPFYSGKRMCIGYTIAELNLHMIIGNLTQRFDFHLPEDYEIQMFPKGLYQCMNPFIDIKLRN